MAGPTLVLLATAGLWWGASRAEQRVLDDSDAVLARHAAAFLGVLTPAAGDGYDAPRLLSSANALADASFWGGGLQVALGAVPLVADTIGLVPLPDSVQARLEEGATVVITTHARHRVALVPFFSRDHQSRVGWVAAWRTLTRQIPSRRHVLLTVGVVFALVSATVTLLRYTRPRWRLVAVVAAFGMVGLLALSLGLSVRRTAVAATDLRLLTLRRLVEIAATAEGVRQARLPEIGVGTVVRRLAPPGAPPDDVMREEAADGNDPVASIVAATPRTQGGIVFRVTPAEAGLGRLWLGLTAWLGLAGLGLGLLASGGGARPRV